MSNKPTQEELDVERQRKVQRLVNAWHRVAATDDGKAIIEDLEERFRLKDTVFNPIEKQGHYAYDPLTAALTEGGRQVVIFIHQCLAAEAKGDGNITEAKTTVSRESKTQPTKP